MMRFLTIIFLFGFTYAQSPIEEFEKVMEQFNEDYTNAKDDKERSAVDEKYSKLIDAAEQEFEQAIEEQIQKENAALLKEQQESEKEIEGNGEITDDNEEDESKESELLKTFKSFINGNKGDEYISKYFYKKELREIAYELEIKPIGTELNIIKQIKEKL